MATLAMTKRTGRKRTNKAEKDRRSRVRKLRIIGRIFRMNTVERAIKTETGTRIE